MPTSDLEATAAIVATPFRRRALSSVLAERTGLPEALWLVILKSVSDLWNSRLEQPENRAHAFLARHLEDMPFVRRLAEAARTMDGGSLLKSLESSVRKVLDWAFPAIRTRLPEDGRDFDPTPLIRNLHISPADVRGIRTRAALRILASMGSQTALLNDREISYFIPGLEHSIQTIRLILFLEWHRHWKPAIPDRRERRLCLNLLALATLLGGLDLSTYRDPPSLLVDMDILPAGSELSSLKPSLHHLGLRDDDVLPPFDAGYVAEYLVLKTFWNVLFCSEEAYRELTAYFWSLDDSRGPATARAFRSIARHYLGWLRKMDHLAPPPEAPPRAVLNFLEANRGNHAGDECTPPDRLLEVARRLRRVHPGNEAVAVGEAELALSIVRETARRGFLEDPRIVFQSFEWLRKDLPELERVAELHAEATAYVAVGLILHSADEGGAEFYWNTFLKPLREDFPRNERIAVVQARAAALWIREMVGFGNPCEDRMNDIEQLAQTFPDNAEVSLALAFARGYRGALAREKRNVQERAGWLRKAMPGLWNGRQRIPRYWLWRHDLPALLAVCESVCPGRQRGVSDRQLAELKSLAASFEREKTIVMNFADVWDWRL